MGGDAAQATVGRDGELTLVTGLLDDALAGRRRLVLCTGEAGIGKTRLADDRLPPRAIAAPVVTMTRTGPSAAILALIAPTAPGARITAAISTNSPGSCRLRARIGARELSFLISAGADIRAG